ncbi:MAG: metallophosphoesterase family protein [Solirubrobacterales bacterium]|nr:metallophosphoesterase family protein [Solirubrobacterales bacterium]
MGATTTIAIISDTHLPRGSRELPARCVELCRGADLILHAGDLAAPEVLDALEALGPPTHAVAGNVDPPALHERLPAQRVVEVGEVRIGMVHDAGPAAGRMARMQARFGGVDAVVFGHSHIPLHETAVVAGHPFQLFNPGSPTDRRRQPHHTMGLAHVRGDEVGFEHVRL